MGMMRAGFLSPTDRTKLGACVCFLLENRGIARRANEILLLDEDESCAQIAKFLYLDDDTIRSWLKAYLHDRWDALALSCAFRRIRSAVSTTSGQSFRSIRSPEDRCRVGMVFDVRPGGLRELFRWG